MKILAIRGKNLASLAGDFGVDFEQEPLKSAGLFAISGSTGAGKSTLLDALCMALYESTPRLLKAGGGKTLPDGTDLITHQDAANLLRRGCGEGFAEVDFVGNDGASYRARWSVRRARGSVKGSLQASKMTLHQLPELQPIGGTNREVKAEIIQRIGLSFEQFTRAVLLAQNEFSSFLKADDNERGELLETLTGSTIYSVLSQRAFSRAKLELQALQRINDRLADQKPLDSETRAALDTESIAAQQNLAQLEQTLTHLNHAVRWHQEADKIGQNIQAAQLVEQTAAHAATTAAIRRDTLQQLESVQAARPLIAELDRARHATAQTALTIATNQTQLDAANTTSVCANTAFMLAQTQQQTAEQAQAAAAPQLDTAKKLDASIEARLPAMNAAKTSLAQANLAVTENTKQRAQKHDELNQGYAQLEQTNQWLEANTHSKNLAENWPAYEVLLQQAAQAHAAAQQAGAQQTQFALESSALNHQVATAKAELANTQLALQAIEQQRQAANTQFASIDISTLPEEKAQCATRRDHLTSAQSLLQRLAEQSAQAAKLSTQQQDHQAHRQQTEHALAQATAQRPVLAAALMQSERSLKLAEAACNENVESLRETLLDDAPCPVCGGLDHPYVQNSLSDNPQLHALLTGLQAEVAQCRQQHQEQLNQQATLTAELSNLQRTAQTIAAELSAISNNLATQNSQWATHPLYAEIIVIQEVDRLKAVENWLAAQIAALQTQTQAIADKEQAWQMALQVKEAAQAKFERASQAQLAQKDAVQTQQTALDQITAQLAAAQAAQQQETQRLATHLAQLAPALQHLPNWQADWTESPAAQQAQWQQTAQTWLAQRTAHANGQQETALLALSLAAISEASQKAIQEQQRISEQCHAEQTAIDALQAERLALFAGQTVQSVEAQLAQAMASAKSAHTQAQQAAHDASQHATRTQEALTQAQNQQRQTHEQALAAQQQLDTWLNEHAFGKATPFEGADSFDESIAFDETALRHMLSFDAAWLTQERAALLAIDSALLHAKTVLQERITQQQNHAAQRPATILGTAEDAAETDSQPNAPLTLAQLSAQAAQISAAQQAAHATATRLQIEIAQDEARRSTAAGLLAEIAAQETQQRRWAQLGELIGSSDGKKFRNYAQQYTLDVLLAYTNRHLQQLSRRYRLQRINDTLAMMVIDQDMGDEARSVHSLSGGESFLVSLALALGLASLSSNRVRVESLFIDEGFGSLDAETLRVAMDALDGLQAMGRKVGVISHVQEMTERIATKILVQKTAGGRSLVSVN